MGWWSRFLGWGRTDSLVSQSIAAAAYDGVKAERDRLQVRLQELEGAMGEVTRALTRELNGARERILELEDHVRDQFTILDPLQNMLGSTSALRDVLDSYQGLVGFLRDNSEIAALIRSTRSETLCGLHRENRDFRTELEAVMVTLGGGPEVSPREAAAAVLEELREAEAAEAEAKYKTRDRLVEIIRAQAEYIRKEAVGRPKHINDEVVAELEVLANRLSGWVGG